MRPRPDPASAAPGASDCSAESPVSPVSAVSASNSGGTGKRLGRGAGRPGRGTRTSLSPLPAPASAAPAAGRLRSSPASSPRSSSSTAASSGPEAPISPPGRRRLRPPREPRRRRLRTAWPSPPEGAAGSGPPWFSEGSGRSMATGSWEAARASGVSSDMEPFPPDARRNGAPARCSGRQGHAGARSRTVSAGGTQIAIGDGCPRQHPGAEQAQPTLEQCDGSPGGGSGVRAQAAKSRDSWPGKPWGAAAGWVGRLTATTRPGGPGGLGDPGQQRFVPRPEGLHHVGVSLAGGTATAPVSRTGLRLRATLATRPTPAKEAMVAEPP